MLYHALFVECVAFPVVVSSSDFQSLVWEVFSQHMSAPINTGGHANYFILAAWLAFIIGDFQIVCAFVCYIRANLKYCSGVYYTIAQVSRATPILVHCTAAVLALPS